MEYCINDVESYNAFREHIKTVQITKVNTEKFTVSTAEDTFIIIPKYWHFLAKNLKTTLVYSSDTRESEFLSDIVFGKDKREGIVSIEFRDNVIYLYKKDGTVKEEEFYPYIVTSYSLSKSSIRLDGNNPLKYLTYYPDIMSLRGLKKQLRQKEVQFYSPTDLAEMYMVHSGVTLFKGMKINEVSVLSTDIEASGLVKDETSRVFIIGNTFRKNGLIIRKSFYEDDYKNPRDMFIAWIAWVREMNPDFMVGHNIISYDLPYIAHCARMHGVPLTLGRDGSEMTIDNWTSKFRKDQAQFYEYNKVRIFGISIVDTFFLSIRYDTAEKKYTSYKLKTIINQEGLEKEGRVFYDASKIRDNWNNLEERAKIKAYCSDDADDALALLDLMLPSYFYYSQHVPKTIQEINGSATGAQIDSVLVRSYIQKGISIPLATQVEKYEGGISFGIPKIYKNIWKLDVASLYPSIMIQYKVFDEVKDPNEHFFKMIQYFTKERLKNKKLSKNDKHYKDLSDSQKIFINSAYGLLGASGLHFNSIEKAAFVTQMGREILGKAIMWATGKDTEHWVKAFKKACGKEEEDADTEDA